jgi:hypothetical protein
VTNETALRFMNSVKGVAQFRQYADEFRDKGGAKVGNTVLIRLPQRYYARRGQGWVPQALLDRTTPVTLSYQSGVDFEWSSAQATTELDRVRERYVNPAADTLASDADQQGMQDVYTAIWNAVGTPGTTPTTNLTYLQAKVKILDGAGPEDGLCAVLDPLAEATLVNANLTLFNPTSQISSQYRRGMFAAEALGIGEWYRDQNIPRHTTGTFTSCTPQVNGANQTGSTIATNGWASGATTLKKGDIVEFAGCYSVNPISRVSTGRLQQFTITADVADSGGAIAALPISPSIITSGALQTVSASPASGAAVYVWNTRSTTYALSTTVSPQSLILHESAAAFVMVDLAEPNGGAKATFARSRDWGISIRFVQQYQLNTDQNGNRLDMLFGAAPVRVENACRVAG